MPDDRLHDAISAGALAGEQVHGALLRSVVDVARTIFDARAASIMLVDEATGELVFEAVSGEGSQSLVGSRFPLGKGVAGFVAASGQTLVIDDVSRDPRFAGDVAKSTGYTPQALMAAPLLEDGEAFGVLSVLDRGQTARVSTLADIELLELLAAQASTALSIVQRARAARRAVGEDGRLAALARVAAKLDDLGEDRQAAAERLLIALDEILGAG